MNPTLGGVPRLARSMTAVYLHGRPGRPPRQGNSWAVGSEPRTVPGSCAVEVRQFAPHPRRVSVPPLSALPASAFITDGTGRTIRPTTGTRSSHAPRGLGCGLVGASALLTAPVAVVKAMSYWFEHRYCRTGDTAPLVHASLGSLVDELGLDWISYALIRPPSGRAADFASTAFANYPAEWIERYLKECYQLLDAVLDIAIGSPRPFFWGHARYVRAIRQPQRRLYDESRAFGIYNGLSIPVHGADGAVGVFSVAADCAKRLRDVVGDEHERLFAAAYDDHDIALGAMPSAPEREAPGPRLSVRERVSALDRGGQDGGRGRGDPQPVGVHRQPPCFQRSAQVELREQASRRHPDPARRPDPSRARNAPSGQPIRVWRAESHRRTHFGAESCRPCQLRPQGPVIHCDEPLCCGARRPRLAVGRCVGGGLRRARGRADAGRLGDDGLPWRGLGGGALDGGSCARVRPSSTAISTPIRRSPHQKSRRHATTARRGASRAMLLDVADTAWSDPRLDAVAALVRRGLRVLVVVLLRQHRDQARLVMAYRRSPVLPGDLGAARGPRGARARGGARQPHPRGARAHIRARCGHPRGRVRDTRRREPRPVLSAVARLFGAEPFARVDAVPVNRAEAVQSAPLAAAAKGAAWTLRSLGARRLLQALKDDPRIARLVCRPAGTGDVPELSDAAAACLDRRHAARRAGVETPCAPLGEGLWLARPEVSGVRRDCRVREGLPDGGTGVMSFGG